MFKPIAIVGGGMVVVGVIGFFAVGFQGGAFFTASSTAKIDQVKQLPSSGVTDIEVSTDATAIHLVPANQNQITVHLYGYLSNKDYYFSAAENDNTVQVDFRRHWHVQLFNWFQVHNDSVTVDVSVPRQEYERISLKTNAGTVSASQMTSREWDIRTNAGAIRTDFLSGNVYAATNAGKIEASNTNGDLRLEANAGRIQVNQQRITHNITAKTNAGAISISTKKAPKALQLHLTTDVGRVSMDLPGANMNSSSHDWIGSIGTGGPSVVAKTNVGAITVNQE